MLKTPIHHKDNKYTQKSALLLQREKAGMRGIQTLDFTLLTPALSNRRGNLWLLQHIVFIV